MHVGKVILQNEFLQFLDTIFYKYMLYIFVFLGSFAFSLKRASQRAKVCPKWRKYEWDIVSQREALEIQIMGTKCHPTSPKTWSEIMFIRECWYLLSNSFWWAMLPLLRARAQGGCRLWDFRAKMSSKLLNSCEPADTNAAPKPRMCAYLSATDFVANINCFQNFVSIYL